MNEDSGLEARPIIPALGRLRQEGSCELVPAQQGLHNEILPPNKANNESPNDLSEVVHTGDRGRRSPRSLSLAWSA